VRGLEGLTVLVADDNRHMRLLLKSMLRAYGLKTVLEAADGRDTMRLAQDTFVDLILMDWAMRPIDGIQVAQAIRSGPNVANPYCTIIMVSGHAGASRVLRARDAGVNSFLVKPVSAVALRAHLKLAFSDMRPFVRAPGYRGPDRRAGRHRPYGGPLRRREDERLKLLSPAGNAGEALYL
jgi:two-component system, chemotaxis family, chemotaxis protein CheY